MLIYNNNNNYNNYIIYNMVFKTYKNNNKRKNYNYTKKKTLKNNFLDFKRHKQFLNKETYDRFELLVILRKVNKRLLEIKSKLKSKMRNKNLLVNDYYFLHNVRNLLSKK